MTSIPSTTCTAAEEDHFVAGPSSVTPVLLRRLHLGTSQTTYLFNNTTHNFLCLQLPTNLSTSMATKTSCSSAPTSAFQSGSTSVTSRCLCWDFMTSLTAVSSCTSTARTAHQLNIKVRVNLYTIIAVISSSMLWLSTWITKYITIGFSTFNNTVSTAISTS